MRQLRGAANHKGFPAGRCGLSTHSHGTGQAVFTLIVAVLDSQSLSYVIPSVAEESEMPVIDSISRFSDSSATLGMT